MHGIDSCGVVLTKLDGDTRGGVALSVRHLTNVPIKFIGVSEKLDGLDSFDPDRMAGRILGMGDIVSLVEKATEVIDEKEAEKTNKTTEIIRKEDEKVETYTATKLTRKQIYDEVWSISISGMAKKYGREIE